MLGTPHIATARGDLAFFDADMSAPLLSVNAYMEPVQDLHGYEYPWPAGGGENKYNAETKTVGQALNTTNGGTYNNASWEVSDFIPVSSGEITLAWDSQTYFYQANICAYDANKNYIADSGISYTDFSYSHTFTVPSETKFVRFSWSFIVSGTEYQRTNVRVSIGTADLGYTPYSNICPIEGWPGVEVTRTGKNLVNVNSTDNIAAYIDLDGNINTSTTWTTSALIKVTGGMPYVLSGLTAHPNTNNDNFRLYDKQGSYIGHINVNTSQYPVLFSADVGYVQFCWKDMDSESVMFIQGSETVDYEPYTADVYNIAFPTEAGTVYGGTIDVITGVLSVDRAIVDLGSLHWSYQLTINQVRRYYTSEIANFVNRPVNNNTQANLLSSIFVKASANDGFAGRAPNSVTADTNGTLAVYPSAEYASATDFKTAMSGVQLVYELAAPITYQLTPHAITALMGANTVYSDANGDVIVKFWERGA